MLNYRRELDGVRALSVIAVIFYHANLSINDFHFFKGGFFGVDVFLVISGYLITAIIRSDMERNQFSLFEFYARRIKRIVPALLVMLFITSGVSYFTLFPKELVSYTESLKSALIFSSNYFFYGEDSYVADSSIYKPLLHTWSLAIEWQFYLLYPVIVWGVCKFAKKYLFGILLILAMLSLQYANVIVPDYPDMAFYLLPSRSWELILGGLVTFFDRNAINKLKEGAIENVLFKALPLLGVFLILYSMIFIDHTVAHPSFVTLMPVIGACSFLMFAHKGELATDFFSIKPVVSLGVISYSLYLYHQPVFVFFRLFNKPEINLENFISLFLISIFFALLTYKFIEKPFRKNLSIVKKSILSSLFVSLMLFSYFAIKYEGVIGNVTERLSSTLEMYKVAEFRRLSDPVHIGKSLFGNSIARCNMRSVDTACKFGDESWVTIGDSFAGQYDFALHEKTQKINKGMISLSYEQCPFVSKNIWFRNTPECSQVNENRLKAIDNFKHHKNIIITADYYQFFEPKEKTSNPIKDSLDGFKGGKVLKTNIAWESYVENINYLLNKEHDVYVIYPTPTAGFDVEKEVFSQLRFRKNVLEEKYTHPESYGKAISLSSQLDKYLPNHPRLHKIYPVDILCKDKKCMAINELGGLYNGGNHLSYIGSKMILDSFIKDEEN